MTGLFPDSKVQRVPTAVLVSHLNPRERYGMDDFVSCFCCPGKEFDTGNTTGFVFKVMNFAEIPLLDYFFPLAYT
jgi:hypothetical protein